MSLPQAFRTFSILNQLLVLFENLTNEKEAPLISWYEHMDKQTQYNVSKMIIPSFIVPSGLSKAAKILNRLFNKEFLMKSFQLETFARRKFRERMYVKAKLHSEVADSAGEDAGATPCHTA